MPPTSFLGIHCQGLVIQFESLFVVTRIELVVRLLLQLLQLLHLLANHFSLGMIGLDLEDLLEKVAGQILAVFEVEAERLHIQAVGVCVETLEKQSVQMKKGHKYNLKQAIEEEQPSKDKDLSCE
jgi:hypothetical protein